MSPLILIWILAGGAIVALAELHEIIFMEDERGRNHYSVEQCLVGVLIAGPLIWIITLIVQIFRFIRHTLFLIRNL